MTSMHLFCLASVAAAVLFFAAGAATMALRHRDGLPGAAHVIPPRSEIAEAATLPVFEPARADELRDALATALATVHEQKLQLEDRATLVRRSTAEAVEREMKTLRERATSGEVAAREVQVLRARVETAEAATGAVRTREQRVQGELDRARTYAATVTRELERARTDAATATRELDRARSDVAAATRELDQLQAQLRTAQDRLTERAQAARELATQNEQLKGRMTDAEAVRAEYVRLRTTTIDSEFLRSEVARLEQELRTVKIDALGGQRRRPARGSERPPTSSNRTIGESLSTVIERFADAGTRSIAIADTVGFPLASSGEDGLALAAYAALLIESANRGKELLPLAAPSAIEIIDERGARLSVWTFNVESDRLLLVNLSVTPVDAGRVEATLADLSAILTPTAARSFT
jgi:hypothetical protein